MRDRSLTGVERTFGNDEIIVSKTDLKGRIVYANEVFLRVSGYGEDELLGQPHAILRHPAMPRAVFRLLWQRIQSAQEIFAYVVNRCRNGDHYWVFAHVTPNLNAASEIVGYHSNRRIPTRSAVETLAPIYAELCRIEDSHENRKLGLEQACQHLESIIASKGTTYDRMVLAL